MRKIILVLFMLLLVFLIYYLNMDRKVYILSIGDYIVLNNSNFDNDMKDYFGKKLEKNISYGNDGDYRIIDLMNDINGNKKFVSNGNEYTLDNTLIKADLIIISIGINDLKYNKKNNNYDYIDEVIDDLDNLFCIIRKYSKEKIIVFNYYLDDNKLNKYINSRLDRLANKYNIDIIDFNDNYDVLNSSIINYLDKLY